ncbi:AMP-binding protein [uncultured Roseobacter sp.]|uniref:AMP-binding protein n=1 Tax=uncultured Roseobacter sp. TaxID=114847 RepID=UPI00260B3E3F|nr:AMP-binding protein [uncultured Roseobacter sp.]
MTRMHSTESTPTAELLNEGLTAIEAANSIEFLKTIFNAYDAGELFAITRSDIDPALYSRSVTKRYHQSETRGWVRLDHQLSNSDLPVQIVFTSGTEGQPKAIVLTHRNLADVVQRLNDVMQVTDAIREYIGVPVTYSFGLGRARSVSAAGGSFFLPERFDPTEIRTMLEAGEINAISAVPSLWRLILAAPDAIGTTGEAVRWIEIGSQYMSAEEKLGLQKIFPSARIVQHYGMTEASRTTFLVISGETDMARLESVGPADDRVRIGETGAIEIRGPHVALGQITPGGAISPLTGPDRWLRSSDRGEIRDGMLYFLGRLDDQMNLGGIKVGSEALETRVAALLPEATGHFALTPVTDQMRGEVVLLAMEPPTRDMADLVAASVLQALKEKGVSAGGSLKRLMLDTLPRTATGKISRAALRDMAAEVTPISETAPTKTAAAASLSEKEKWIAELWIRVLGKVEIGPQNSFYESGGDSLSGLQAGLVMEKAGLPRAAINATFEGAPLQEVAALATADASAVPSPGRRDTLPSQTRLTWSLTLTRAMVVIAVLLSHWAPGVMNVLGLPESLFISYTRLGTPGFAFVFGIGVGLYMLPEMHRNAAAVYHRADRAALLVGIGAVMMGIVYLLYARMQGNLMNWLTVSNAFYSVLLYYVIALVTARLWLPLLARLKFLVTSVLILALVLWGLWQIMREIMPASQYVSLVEILRLMLGAGGYNIFKLGTMTAVGIAVGYWITQQKDLELVRRQMLLFGGFGAVFCAAAVLQIEGTIVLMQSTRMHTSLLGLGYYGSLCLLMLGIFLTLMPDWAQAQGGWRVLLRVALAFGGLALPIYVLHQFVIPVYKVLELQGLPYVVALWLPMSIFIAVMLYLGHRIYRMYGT